MFSPSSDKRFWSTLRSRVDSLIEDRNKSESVQVDVRVETEMSKRLKEDSTLLLKGFDSVAQTLSLLSNNIDNALQGIRDLAKPPTLTEIFHSKVTNAEENPKKQQIASRTAIEPSYTAEGFELSVGTNHLRHFLLSRLLLDYLNQSDYPSRRLIIVGSITGTATTEFVLGNQFDKFMWLGLPVRSIKTNRPLVSERVVKSTVFELSVDDNGGRVRRVKRVAGCREGERDVWVRVFSVDVRERQREM
ncbi:hypothetical protein ACFE04_021783 [Oxalis oulophora]